MLLLKFSEKQYLRNSELKKMKGRLTIKPGEEIIVFSHLIKDSQKNR